MANLQNLTTAEQRIGDLLQQGLSNKAIAQHLVISIRTVESHISRALAKTGTTSRLQLVMFLLREAEKRPNLQPRQRKIWLCRLSSVVEQRFCKAKAIGSNPLAGFSRTVPVLLVNQHSYNWGDEAAFL